MENVSVSSATNEVMPRLDFAMQLGMIDLGSSCPANPAFIVPAPLSNTTIW